MYAFLVLLVKPKAAALWTLMTPFEVPDPLFDPPLAVVTVPTMAGFKANAAGRKCVVGVVSVHTI